jgi:UDP-N-acetylmuramate dehydrogenase
MSSNNKKIRKWLTDFDVEFDNSVELSVFSCFKSGGTVDYILFPKEQAQLTKCICWLNQEKIPFKVIGETSNLMFLDDVNYGCLVSTKKMSCLKHNSETEEIVADCGAPLPMLARYALSRSITGFEGLEGIPGTVGAAVFMNAGAYGDDIKKTLNSVDVVLEDGSIKKYRADEVELSHRNSIFRTKKRTEIILRCYFKGKRGDAFSIYNKMSLLHAKRHKYQEFMYPTLGSIYSGSIYRSLAKKDLFFKLISISYYLVFYRWKLFRRESPDNRKWLNDIAVKRFGITYRVQPFSNKDMNTLVNNGHHTDELLDYITQLQQLIGDEIPIENEIVEKI